MFKLLFAIIVAIILGSALLKGLGRLFGFFTNTLLLIIIFFCLAFFLFKILI